MFASINNFDPKTLSDDELFDKQIELTRRQILAFRMGKVEVANQVKMFIQVIETERRERMFVEIIGNRILKSSPVSIETDPDLKIRDEIEITNVSDTKPTKPTKPMIRPIRRPVRSNKPLPPKSGNS